MRWLARVQGGLDGWLAPRWRAVLTWGVAPARSLAAGRRSKACVRAGFGAQGRAMSLPPKFVRALDWWFAARWRVLATWAAAAVVMWSVGVSDLISDVVTWAALRLQAMLPFPLPVRISDLWMAAALSVIVCWWKPLLLRLGLARWLAWVVATTLFLWAIRGNSSQEWIAAGLLLSFPALAMVGRRGRPWMALIGTAAVAGIIWMASLRSDRPWVHLRYYVLADIVLGAVLIYGTKPLPPRAAAGAAGPEPTPDVPPPAP